MNINEQMKKQKKNTPPKKCVDENLQQMENLHSVSTEHCLLRRNDMQHITGSMSESNYSTVIKWHPVSLQNKHKGVLTENQRNLRALMKLLQ